MQLIQRGIYPMPFDDYRRIPAVNRGTIAAGQKSPMHMRHELDNPRRETKAMQDGRVFHTAVLEPELFGVEYAVMPDMTEGLTTKDGKPTRSKNSSAYRERVAAWQEDHAGAEIIDADMLARCEGMREAIATHSIASRMLDAEHKEVVAVADLMGVPCKVRPDAIGDGVLWDLKTTADARPGPFGKKAHDLGYPMQFAFYVDVLGSLGCVPRECKIVAVEADAPHGVMVYTVTPEQIAYGRQSYERLLAAYVTASRREQWHGYPEADLDLELPAWAETGGDVPTTAIPDFDLTIGGAA